MPLLYNAIVCAKTKKGVHMAHKKKKIDSDEPQPLNFDQDEEKGPSDHLKNPFMTPDEERGDSRDDQYYEEEESISPEEVEERKEDDDLQD